jgi:hypothetical protein
LRTILIGIAALSPRYKRYKIDDADVIDSTSRISHSDLYNKRSKTKDDSDARRDFYAPVGNRRAGRATTTKRRPTNRTVRAVQPKQPVHVQG